MISQASELSSNLIRATKTRFLSVIVKPVAEQNESLSPTRYAKGIKPDNKSNAGSLCDIEPCSGLLQGQDTQSSSLASTNVGSRMSIEGRSFSRNMSLLFESTEEDRSKSHSPMIYPAQSTLQDLIEEHSEIEGTLSDTRLDEMLNNGSIMEIPTEVEKKTETVSAQEKPEWHNISPVFDTESIYASSYTFANNNKTVTHGSNIRFSTIFAEKPIPSTGKSKFLMYVNYCNKTNPKLYVGLSTGENRDKPLAYKLGNYFVSTFSMESYLNGLKRTSPETFVKQGQTISVLIDMDQKMITFELEGSKILEGKLVLPKGQDSRLYPCISLGELGGTVSFI